MNLFDDENKIIEHFQRIQDKEVFFPKLDDKIESLYKSIHELNEWTSWKYSAGKDDPPPDYYNENMSVMMDVMRVDDHAFLSKKGKVVNPTNAGESKLRKELDESGILEYFPNCKEYSLMQRLYFLRKKIIIIDFTKKTLHVLLVSMHERLSCTSGTIQGIK